MAGLPDLHVSAKNAIARVILTANRNVSRRGRPKLLSDAMALSAIYYMCRTGCQWAALDLAFPQVSYKTIYHRFTTWSKRRIFEGAFYDMAKTHHANHERRALITDCSHVKNVKGSDVTGKNHADRARKSTKVSILVDALGIPLGMTVHPGNRHDSLTLPHLLKETERKLEAPLRTHATLSGDAGYRGERCRNFAHQHGLRLVIPDRNDLRIWDATRWKVERTFANIDLHRRVILRYDTHIHAFKSFHFLAMLSQLTSTRTV